VTWAVYGHGSFFAGVEDAADVDVLVVTDEPITREAAAARVGPLVGAPRRLPLDVTVVRHGELGVIERGVVRYGRLLDGDDLAASVAPVRPFEWALAMHRAAAQASEPARAALAAIRAAWAAAGRVVVPKSAVPGEARGGRWEALAAAAWQARRDATFDHPDLEAALDAATWAAAGEAASAAHEVRGWSSRANRCAVLTVYRGVLDGAEVDRLATAAAVDWQHGGWRKSVVDEPRIARRLAELVEVANAYWWHLVLAGVEPFEVHRHPAGSSFPAHVDRLPLCPTRALNVVAMIRAAERGGRLFLDLGGEAIRPELSPGDVVVFDGGYLHGVTAVDAGERVTLVTHAHRAGADR
jgi:hypothetical protein